MTKNSPEKKPLSKPVRVAATIRKTAAAKPKSAVAKARPVAAKPGSAVSGMNGLAKKPVAKANKVSVKVKPAAEQKVKKPKLVRDSFTMPEAEYQVLGDVKKACIKAGFEVKKSELLRVGVALIRKMDLASLRAVLVS